MVSVYIAAPLKPLTHPRTVVSVSFFIGTILQYYFAVQLNLMNCLIIPILMDTCFDNLKGCVVLQLPLLCAIWMSILILPQHLPVIDSAILCLYISIM